eukprot:CAMPEP_0197917548 /NCGR_PEP_ID=MMETSP1439-20131203/83985_1 /TAXON_ID=66791 /ORGANISM="Gonyaulax spinifera, Strain CCMP409" /LENGTH=94 /DNA_ID=CAMNT_0043539627 /DNA_START=138 /DNA_END=422 /DNA_ORIENTATION=-
MRLSSRSAWASRFFASGVDGGVHGGVPFISLLLTAAGEVNVKWSSSMSTTCTAWRSWSGLIEHLLAILVVECADSRALQQWHLLPIAPIAAWEA